MLKFLDPSQLEKELKKPYSLILHFQIILPVALEMFFLFLFLTFLKLIKVLVLI